MRTYIDPPSGHRYGFPRELPLDVTDINEWLVENGYPQSIIDEFKGNVPCGVWYETDEEPKRFLGRGTYLVAE